MTNAPFTKHSHTFWLHHSLFPCSCQSTDTESNIVINGNLAYYRNNSSAEGQGELFSDSAMNGYVFQRSTCLAIPAGNASAIASFFRANAYDIPPCGYCSARKKFPLPLPEKCHSSPYRLARMIAGLRGGAGMSISAALPFCVKKNFLAYEWPSKNGIVQPKGV